MDDSPFDGGLVEVEVEHLDDGSGRGCQETRVTLDGGDPTATDLYLALWNRGGTVDDR